MQIPFLIIINSSNLLSLPANILLNWGNNYYFVLGHKPAGRNYTSYSLIKMLIVVNAWLAVPNI